MGALSPVPFAGLFVFLSSLLGGGLPLGVPPLPEDPVSARIAPEHCLFYLSSAGMAAPDANSGNQTEQLLAEPEVRRMAAEIQRALQVSLAREMKDKEAPEHPSADELVALAKLPLTRPTAVYVSNLQIGPEGPVIGSLRAGAVVNLGDSLEKTKAEIEQLVGRLPTPLVETLTIGGQSWQRIWPAPGVSVVWGFKGKHFWLGIGEGELGAMLKRAAGKPPAWLDRIAHDLPIERRSNVTYVNLKAVRELVVAMTELQGGSRPDVIKALGLGNVTALCAVAGLDQQGFISRAQVTIDGPSQGVLQLLDGAPLKPADLATIPGDATFAAAVKIDPQKAYQTLLSVAENIHPSGRAELQRDVAGMEAATRLKLEEQILAPLGDTWRVFDSPGEGGALMGATAVVSLKDPKQAAATQARLLELFKGKQPSAEQEDEDTGLHRQYQKPARIDAVEFSGKTIYVYQSGGRDFPIAPAWCITDKELVVALGAQSVKAYLARPAGFQSLAQAPEVTKAVRESAGLMGVTYCNCQRVFDTLYPALGIWAQVATTELRFRGVELGAGLLPSARSIRSHLQPAVSVVCRTPAGIEISARASLPCMGLLSAAPMAPAASLLLWMPSGRHVDGPRRVYPPGINAVAAGKRAIEMFDTDKDGKLSGKELDECPGLKSACTPTATGGPSTVDPAGTGEITAQMITDRIKQWQASRLGRMSLRCMVKHGGEPLEGADVKFVPEKFLGPNIKTATGKTDQNGVAMLSIPTESEGGPPGVPPGFYRVEITKAGTKIPAKYNQKTIFGQEVAIDAEGVRNGINFDLDY